MDEQDYEYQNDHIRIDQAGLLYEYEVNHWIANDWLPTPTTMAILSDQTIIMQHLLDQGEDITTNDNYILDLACRRGRTEMILLLLDNGATFSINLLCLIWACRHGCTDSVQLLIDHGIDITYDNNRPLLEAHAGDYTETCKLLLSNGASWPTRPAW